MDKNFEKEIQKTRDIKVYNNAKKDIQIQAMKLLSNPEDINNILETLTKIKTLPILSPFFYEPIFNKLNYKDRTFFKSFTTTLIQNQHAKKNFKN